MRNNTAIQALIEEMESLLHKPYINPKNTLNDCIHLAYNKLKMERELIEDAWLNGMKGEMIAPLSIENYRPEAKEYYNEAFGGDMGVIVFDNIRLTNTSGTNHLSHINPLTDKITNGGSNE